MTTDVLPWRGTAGPGSPGRPASVPLPPAPLPLVRGGRLLKRWRYVGVFGPELMLCVGAVRVGPARQAFWAVWDRRERRLRERTAGGRGAVRLAQPGRVVVEDGDARIDLVLDEGPGVETVTPYGRGYAWTRKQGGVPVRGTVEVGGRRHSIAGRAVVDDSAGYPDRRVSWRWSAGVGRAVDDREVAWNLVSGIHDRPEASERTIWISGEPREVGRVAFAEDLSLVAFAEGGELRFAGEAVRARRERRVAFRSDYEQPFGTFAGVLPGAVTLAEGYGVMERHEVVW